MECRARGFAFAAARSFGIYQGNLARAIVLLEYEQMEPLGAWFARRVKEVCRGLPEGLTADAVVPAPLDRTRRKERGFNQVDLFGRPLARRLGLP